MMKRFLEEEEEGTKVIAQEGEEPVISGEDETFKCEVCEDLLKEVIEISDEDVTLEESINGIYKSNKKFSDKCEFCDFKVEASKK